MVLSEEAHRACSKVLKDILAANNGVYAVPFLQPVGKDVPGYYEVIKNPIDIGRIKSKLGKKGSKSKYLTIQKFKEDLDLMLQNALKFNEADKDLPGLTVYGCAKHLQVELERSWKTHTQSLQLTPQDKDINSAKALKAKMLEVLQELLAFPEAKQFVKEPNWEELYLELIEEPLSLEIVQKRLKIGEIHSLGQFVDQVRTVFANCLRYFVDPIQHKDFRTPALNCLAKFNKSLYHTIPEAVKLRPQPSMNAKDILLCSKIIESMLRRPGIEWFVRPVHKYGVELPRYDEIIKKPMDLGTVQKKLHLDRYTSKKGFAEDVETAFKNCIQYNKKTNALSMVDVAQALLSSFRKKFQEKFVENRNEEAEAMNACKRVLKKLMKDENCRYFLQPVDWKALKLPSYPKIIRKPMDLGTIKKKLDNSAYENVSCFVEDVNLVFQNCLTFNVDETKDFPIRTWCFTAKRYFKTLYEKEIEPLLVESKDVVESEPKSSKEQIQRKKAVSDFRRFKEEKDCRKLLEKLMKDKRAYPFNAPFDYKAAGLYDYPEIVKKPLDFLTIKKRFATEYTRMEEFINDVELVFSNCLLYNKDQTKDFPIRTWCIQLRNIFREGIDKIREKSQKIKKEESDILAKKSTKSKRSNLPKASLLKVLEELSNLPAAKDFRAPVPWKELGLDDYLDVIKRPMDLQTVRRNLNNGKYTQPEEFAKDVRLIFENCLKYNREESPTYPIRTWAKELLEFFEQTYSKLILEADEPNNQNTRQDQQSAKTFATESNDGKEEAYSDNSLGNSERLESKKASSTLETLHEENVEVVKGTSKTLGYAVNNDAGVTNMKKQIDQLNLETKPRYLHSHTTGGKGKRVRQAAEHEKGQLKPFEIVAKKLLDKFSRNEWASYYYGKPVLEIFKDDVFATSYLSIISKPMDLRTVGEKIINHKYKNLSEMAEDVELIFHNAEVFNSDLGDPVSAQTRAAAGYLRLYWRSLFNEREDADPIARKEDRERREKIVAKMPLKSGNVMRVLKKLMAPSRAKQSHFFMELYDWKKYNTHDYPLIVKKPMALSLVREKVQNGSYETLGEFAADVRLIFENCLLYNKDVPGNKVIRDAAEFMSTVFENAWGEFTCEIVEKRDRKEFRKKYEKQPISLRLYKRSEQEDPDYTDEEEQEYAKTKNYHAENRSGAGMLIRGLSSESLDLDSKPVSAQASRTRIDSSPVSTTLQKQRAMETERLNKAVNNDRFLHDLEKASELAEDRSKLLQQSRMLDEVRQGRKRLEFQNEIPKNDVNAELRMKASEMSIMFELSKRKRKRKRNVIIKAKEEDRSSEVASDLEKIKWKHQVEKFFSSQPNGFVFDKAEVEQKFFSSQPNGFVFDKAEVEQKSELPGEVKFKLPKSTRTSNGAMAFLTWDYISVNDCSFCVGSLFYGQIYSTPDCSIIGVEDAEKPQLRYAKLLLFDPDVAKNLEISLRTEAKPTIKENMVFGERLHSRLFDCSEKRFNLKGLAKTHKINQFLKDFEIDPQLQWRRLETLSACAYAQKELSTSQQGDFNLLYFIGLSSKFR